MIRVAILGSTGMLGHVVAEQLKLDDRFAVTCFCRNPEPTSGDRVVDATSSNHIPPSKRESFDYIINCIGLIKQLKNVSRRDWFTVNSVFPWRLSSQCEHQGSKLIHISTDCVYTGLQGNYTEESSHDVEDDYGLSKSLGEPSNAMVLRTSVIGPEKRGKLSLLEWAISKRGQKIDGYVNHTWNGLTSIEYANVCKKIMLQGLYNHGTYHIFSDAVTKDKLLSMINVAYNLDLNIRSVNAPTKCHRTLSTVKDLNAKLEIPSLAEMIDVMSKTQT